MKRLNPSAEHRKRAKRSDLPLELLLCLLNGIYSVQYSTEMLEYFCIFNSAHQRLFRSHSIVTKTSLILFQLTTGVPSSYTSVVKEGRCKQSTTESKNYETKGDPQARKTSSFMTLESRLHCLAVIRQPGPQPHHQCLKQSEPHPQCGMLWRPPGSGKLQFPRGVNYMSMHPAV